MSFNVRVGRRWLPTIGAWGELHYESSADGGCTNASWNMDLPPTFAHPALVRDSLVEIKFGAQTVWQGVLTEPVAPAPGQPWAFAAVGLSALGADYLCLDASGNSTSTPNLAIDQAIARGLPWVRNGSVYASPFGSGTDATGSLNYLGDLLAAVATAAGQRWGVDENGVITIMPDPTTPTWHLTPGSGRFGLADDVYASTLYGRYLASGAGYGTVSVTNAPAEARFGRKEFGVDLTPLGLISSTTATGALNGLMARGAARLGYTNGLDVSKYQLTTPGGTPASLALVQGGQLVRMFGVPDDQGNTAYHDWVIGDTSYDAGADTIGLTPVGLVARTLADVLSVA